MTAPEAPDLRLDELKELAEQEDLHPFLARAHNVHPSDLADVLSALEESIRVRVISELPLDVASSALAEMEAAEDRDIPDILKYRELIGELFPSLSRREKSRLALETNDVFWAVTAKAQTPSRRVRFALRKLRSMGLRMAVVSNHHSGKSLREMLGSFGMGQYFEVVIASEEVGVRKPNPKIFRICLSRLRLRRDQVIFVGDSLLYDVVGARAAGIVSVLHAEGAPDELKTPRDRHGVKTRTNPGVVPDFIIGDLGSLPRVVEVLGAREVAHR